MTTNERMTTLLRNAHTVKWVGQAQHSPLRLVDYANLANDTLVVSDEVTFGPPGRERRFDVVLWVNGFPVVVIETKTPVNANVSWLNAARDIHNTYEHQCAPSSPRTCCALRPRVGSSTTGPWPARGVVADVGLDRRPLRPGRAAAGGPLSGPTAHAGAGVVDPSGLLPVRGPRLGGGEAEADPPVPAGGGRRGDPRRGSWPVVCAGWCGTTRAPARRC